MTARLADKNPLVIAAVGAAAILLVLAVSLNLKSLAFWQGSEHHAAYLTNASGLAVGDTVQVRGVRVGEIKQITVEGDAVRVDFDVDDGVELGETTSAQVKVLNPLGTVYLGLEPDGADELAEPIPTSRTTVSISLLDDLGELSRRVDKTDIAQLQQALDVTSTNLSAMSKRAVRRSLTGLTEFSGTLAEHADDLTAIVTEGAGIAEILADRKDQIVNLIGQGDVLLEVLQQRRKDIRALVRGTAALSREVADILEVNQEQLNPMLRDLQTISRILAEERDSISDALPALAELSSHVAAATGNGPFLDLLVPNGLIPDDLIDECTDSAYPKRSNPVVGCRP